MNIFKLFLDFILSFFKKDLLHKPFIINNVINELSWHPSRTWSKRGLASVKKIIVHQSLTSYTNTSLSSINKYHIKPGPQNHISPNGAPHICYHYGVEGDGTVNHMNHLSATTWHAKGQNTAAIGILLVGDFDGPSYKGKDGKPSREQLVSLEKLLNYLVDYESLSLTQNDIFGHNDFGKENCPGTVVSNFIQAYKA